MDRSLQDDMATISLVFSSHAHDPHWKHRIARQLLARYKTYDAIVEAMAHFLVNCITHTNRLTDVIDDANASLYAITTDYEALFRD